MVTEKFQTKSKIDSAKLLQIHVWRLSMWRFENHLFASPDIWLVNISEVSCSTLVTQVGKKLNVDQSELEK